MQLAQSRKGIEAGTRPGQADCRASSLNWFHHTFKTEIYALQNKNFLSFTIIFDFLKSYSLLYDILSTQKKIDQNIIWCLITLCRFLI